MATPSMLCLPPNPQPVRRTPNPGKTRSRKNSCLLFLGLLQICTERLREWLASEVLKPLVAAVDGAHKQVVAAAAALGWTGVQLSPLHEAVTGSRPATGGAREGSRLRGPLFRGSCSGVAGRIDAVVWLGHGRLSGTCRPMVRHARSSPCPQGERWR